MIQTYSDFANRFVAPSRSIRALQLLCWKWGGQLIVISGDTFDELASWPFGNQRVLITQAPSSHHHGLNWRAKQVFVARDNACPGALIHEMGHVFASEVDERSSNEPDWLGWEALVARQVGAYNAWSAQNGAYILGDLANSFVEPGDKHDAYEWSELTRTEQRNLLRERIAHGKKIGIVDRKGNPRTIR